MGNKGPKRTAYVPIKTVPAMKARLELEAERRERSVTWVTEQCWKAYLPVLESEAIKAPTMPKGKKK